MARMTREDFLVLAWRVYRAPEGEGQTYCGVYPTEEAAAIAARAMEAEDCISLAESIQAERDEAAQSAREREVEYAREDGREATDEEIAAAVSQAVADVDSSMSRAGQTDDLPLDWGRLRDEWESAIRESSDEGVRRDVRTPECQYDTMRAAGHDWLTPSGDVVDEEREGEWCGWYCYGWVVFAELDMDTVREYPAEALEMVSDMLDDDERAALVRAADSE